MWRSPGPGLSRLQTRDGRSWRMLPSFSFCLAGSGFRTPGLSHRTEVRWCGGPGGGPRTWRTPFALCRAGVSRRGRAPSRGGVGLVRQSPALLGSVRCSWSGPGRLPFRRLEPSGGVAPLPPQRALSRVCRCSLLAGVCCLVCGSLWGVEVVRKRKRWAQHRLLLPRPVASPGRPLVPPARPWGGR